jgi:hypothetical protein
MRAAVVAVKGAGAGQRELVASKKRRINQKAIIILSKAKAPNDQLKEVFILVSSIAFICSW